MADQPNIVEIACDTYEAGGDLSSHQYRFVKLTAARKVGACTAATDRPEGVLLNKPDGEGKAARILKIGRCPLDSDAALAVGNAIGPSADGQAAAKTAGTDTEEYICGYVTLASGAAGEKAEAWVNCVAPHRAA